jgi:adenylate cyclase
MHIPAQGSAPGYDAAAAARRVERPLRLATGLILFAFATSHFINHAFGIRSAAAMQAARVVLLDPWQSQVGLWVLYTSFIVHGLLGLHALFRRRHLRLPASEAWQLALGLTVPLLLITHAAGIRLGTSVYGRDFSYDRVLYNFFVLEPDLGLPRQLILLLIVWIHGCIGLRAWLRSKPWYPRAATVLASLATLVPVLAILGVVNAGLDIREAALRDPAHAASLLIWAGSEGEQAAASASRIVYGLTIAYVGLVFGTLGLRALRDWHAKRFHGVNITYPGQRTVSVPPGFSVLEASRWAGIPHASVCGGRGRCSTCRVRIVQGAQALAAPGPIERLTLRRIGAPPPIRLACQLRPSTDVSIEPLVPAGPGDTSRASRFDAAVEGGLELQIAAMFVDLRESTRLATDRLPYDALFLFDRYIQAVTGAIERNGGRATSIAGDGVMSVFGVDGKAELAARNAFAAARDVWDALERLSGELAGELMAPLRIGMGIHVGMAVVGMVSTRESQTLQFLGDTGNIAAKLEEQSKTLGCTLVASIAALDVAAPPIPGTARAETSHVAIAGREAPIEVMAFRHKSELERLFPRSQA